MPVSVGTKAPDFSLPTKTADGPKQIKLSDNFGKKNTLLLFFPMAFTGVCTTEMCDISQGLNGYTNLNFIRRYGSTWDPSGNHAVPIVAVAASHLQHQSGR